MVTELWVGFDYLSQNIQTAEAFNEKGLDGHQCQFFALTNLHLSIVLIITYFLFHVRCSTATVQRAESTKGVTEITSPLLGFLKVSRNECAHTDMPRYEVACQGLNRKAVTGQSDLSIVSLCKPNHSTWHLRNVINHEDKCFRAQQE